MSALADALNRMTAELMQIASAQEGLERERDYFKQQARRWAEVVERQKLSAAELAQLDYLVCEVDE